MPRPKDLTPKVEWTVVIPEVLHNRIYSKLYSSIMGRVPKGARQQLIIRLLTKWVEEQETRS